MTDIEAFRVLLNKENEKGGGAKWEPKPDDPMVPHSGPAMHLGRGWKVRPFISLKAGETAVLAHSLVRASSHSSSKPLALANA